MRADSLALRGRIGRAAAWLLGAAACGGCGPAVLLDRPGEWPAEYAGRRLYNTPNAFIYASSVEAAGEADRLALEVARRFSSETGGRATKGLLFVQDRHDGLLLAEPQAMFELLHEGEVSQAAASAPADGAASPTWEEQKREFAEIGVPAETMLGCVGFVIRKNLLDSRLGLPQAAATQSGWAATLPTRGRCGAAAREMLDAVLRRSDLSLAQRLIVAPWTPLLEALTADTLIDAREMALYAGQVSAQADWSAERKQTVLGEYFARKSREQMAAADKKAGALREPPDAKGPAVKEPVPAEPDASGPAAP